MSAVLLAVVGMVFAIAGLVMAFLWLMCRGRGLDAVAARPAFVAAVVLLVLAVLSIGSAFAHGDAQWIADNKRYVDESGAHCCGVADCRREQAVKFREAPEGVYVATGAGDEVLVPRRLVGRGLYPSIDDDWWICIRGGVVRCVFKPATGT